MTCQECQLELFDDNPGREALAHAAECSECRELAGEIRANAAALAAMREEPFEVRPFVQPRRPRVWIAGLAAAAAVVLAIGLQTLFRAEPAATPLPVAVAEPAPNPPTSLESVASPEITKRTRAVRPRPAPVSDVAVRPTPVEIQVQEEPQPLLVKMLTPDPDVVIYWLIDPEKGE